MPPPINPVFAAQERSALQQLTQSVASVLAQPVPNPARDNVAPQLALTKQEKAGLILQIAARQQRASSLIQAFASQAKGADEAAEKAKAWGIVASLIAVIIVVVIAIIVSVFTFGAAAGAIVAAVTGAAAVIGNAAAVPISHPLAGEFSTILKHLAAALDNFSRQREQNTRAAIARLFADIDQALTRLEKLPGPAGRLKGCCQGDPRAVFEAVDVLGQSLPRFAGLLQRVPREDMDTRPVVSGLATIQLNVTNIRRILVPKR